MLECISRKKQLKNWHRDWKIKFIKEGNPGMLDISANWYVLRNNQWYIADRILASDPETSSG